MGLPGAGGCARQGGFREECGIFGALGLRDAAQFTAIGMHALQHRGQEACGMVAYDDNAKVFNNVRRIGYVRDHFTRPHVINLLPGTTSLGHVRYSTTGAKNDTALRDVQPLFAEFAEGGVAFAHNGNLTNATALRSKLIREGSIFQSNSDTECIVHLMARSRATGAVARLRDALCQVEGAFSTVAMTRTKLIGTRDPLGFRPLVLGQLGNAYIFASETCALDAVDARFVREVQPGEMLIVSRSGIRSEFPFLKAGSRFCIFEHVYFSRADSIHNDRSVYQVRWRIGAELARETAVEADVVCPVPDSGTPAALGYSQASGIPFAFGVSRNPFVGRTFIEPNEHIRNMGVRLKLNINRPLVEGKRVVLVDDSVVRGTTVRKIASMIEESGAREIHFRVASPPTRWPCFYGVDTPDRSDLIAAQMREEDMAAAIGVNSIRFVSLDGLYKACGEAAGRNAAQPQFCDACFTGEYPVPVEYNPEPPQMPLEMPH